MRIGIIGGGNIGSELFRKAQKLCWDVRFVLKSDGVYRNLTEKVGKLGQYQNYASGLDAVFLAIPTRDDGKIAFNYLSFYLSLDSLLKYLCYFYFYFFYSYDEDDEFF